MNAEEKKLWVQTYASGASSRHVPDLDYGRLNAHVPGCQAQDLEFVDAFCAALADAAVSSFRDRLRGGKSVLRGLPGPVNRGLRARLG